MITIILNPAKSTPGTHVYAPPVDEFKTAALRSLYVQREHIKNPAKRVKVTIEEID